MVSGVQEERKIELLDNLSIAVEKVGRKNTLMEAFLICIFTVAISAVSFLSFISFPHFLLFTSGVILICNISKG